MRLLFASVLFLVADARAGELEALVKACGDADPKVREAAGRALQKHGVACVPLLTKALPKASDAAVEEMARVLGKFGVSARPALPALAPYLKADDRPRLVSNVAQAMGRISGAGPYFTEALEKGTDQTRPNILLGVGLLGNEGVPILVTALADPRVDMRHYALIVLARMVVTNGDETALAMAKCLNDRDANVRVQAAWALNYWGPRARVAGPALVQALYEPTPGAQQLSISALRNLGDDADRLLPLLDKTLRDPKLSNRGGVMSIVAAYGKPALPYLLEGIKDKDLAIRSEAARGLARLDIDLEDHVDDIGRLLQNCDAVTQVEVVTLLARCGPKAVPHLRPALQREHLRLGAFAALKKLGPSASPLMPDVVELYKSAKTPVGRIQAVRTLAALGPDSVGPLTGFLKDAKEPPVQVWILRSLEEFGADARAAMPVVSEAMKSPTPSVREAAERTLEKIADKK